MPAKTKKSPRGKRASTAARKPGGAKGPDKSKETFLQAVSLAQNGFMFDAVQRFCDIVARHKKSDLADDALFNAGLCFLQMRLHHDAIAYFTKVIQGYPKATIAGVGGAQEFGRTAAKAHLGRLRAYLALGDRESARKDLEALKAFGDSYVVDAGGRRRAFHELGAEAFRGA